jgi:hypothetical protein
MAAASRRAQASSANPQTPKGLSAWRPKLPLVVGTTTLGSAALAGLGVAGADPALGNVGVRAGLLSLLALIVERTTHLLDRDLARRILNDAITQMGTLGQIGQAEVRPDGTVKVDITAQESPGVPAATSNGRPPKGKHPAGP